MVSASIHSLAKEPAQTGTGLPQTIKARDVRADSRTRLVTVTRENILISRIYQGIAMRLSVPVSAYHGLVVSYGASTKGLTCSLDLTHSDPDLCVPLQFEEGEDALQCAHKALDAWRNYFGPDGLSTQMGTIPSFGHRRGSLTSGRRRKYAARRKAGLQSLLENSFAGERTIIARS